MRRNGGHGGSRNNDGENNGKTEACERLNDVCYADPYTSPLSVISPLKYIRMPCCSQEAEVSLDSGNTAWSSYPESQSVT